MNEIWITDPLIAEVRRGDYERFLSIQLARAQKRAGLYALTAFAIEIARVAERVSEPLIGHIRFAWWREALEEIREGKKPRNHPVVLALAEVFNECPLLFQKLFVMIEARAADFDPALLADEPAWIQYCDHTAGALHQAWAFWLDPQAAARHEAAIQGLSRRYAMVGLVRAIPFMASRGWMRFPGTRLAVHHLASLTSSPGVKALSKEIVAEASAFASPRVLPKSLLPLRALESISRFYMGRLHDCRYDPYRLRPKKLALVFKIVMLNIKHRLYF